MAQPSVIRGTYFVLGAGDGGSPETFAALCGIDTRSFRHTHATTTQLTRDCADPEDVPVQRLIVTSESWQLQGSGVLNRDNIQSIQALDDGQTHNFRFYWTEPASDTIFQGYYEGPAIITSLDIGGNDGTFGTISLTLDSDGPWTFTQV